jgi:hypothetical protein
VIVKPMIKYVDLNVSGAFFFLCMYVKMVKFWASTTSNIDLLETQIFEFVVLHKVKALQRENVLR